MISTRTATLISQALLFAIGCGAMYMALRLELWRAGSPGPGLFPFVASCGMMVTSGIGMMQTLVRPPAESEAAVDPQGRRRLAIYIVTLFLYALLVDVVGFYAATVFALLAVLKVAERLRWLSALAITAAALAFTELLFARWLAIPFPEGWLWDRLT